MRVCFVLQVRPEMLDEYKRRHAQVWPEMLDALQACGWRNYSLFLRKDGALIGYLETDDFDKARSRMKNNPVNQLWQSEMADFFQTRDGLAPDDQMAPLEEVFHLD